MTGIGQVMQHFHQNYHIEIFFQVGIKQVCISKEAKVGITICLLTVFDRDFVYIHSSDVTVRLAERQLLTQFSVAATEVQYVFNIFQKNNVNCKKSKSTSQIYLLLLSKRFHRRKSFYILYVSGFKFYKATTFDKMVKVGSLKRVFSMNSYSISHANIPRICQIRKQSYGYCRIET